ncbi:MAG: ABC transporter ATP-binding protein/permease [Chlorobiales bacterium]|nr:ABC transporter ATP-binding protein/permease [Chlorobiales bacterium]
MSDALLHKLFNLLTPAQRKGLVVLFLLMCVGMALETLGVGLVVPALALFTQKDIVIQYPQVKHLLDILGDPDQETLVIGGMLLLLAVYIMKALFLVFLAWRQNRFVYRLQADVSQRLFETYLSKTYTFHLQRNSAQLIRNATSEVTLFSNKFMVSSMHLVRESLVLLALCVLLFLIEPLGAMAIVGLFGMLGLVFYRITRSYIDRWGQVRQKHEGMRIQHLQQGLGGVKDVKVLGRESEFMGQYDFHNKRVARVSQLEATMQQIPKLWVELIAVGAFVMLVLTMLARGEVFEEIIPKIGLFAVAAFRLMPSVNRILSAVQTIRYSHPVVNMLIEELALDSSQVSFPKTGNHSLKHELTVNRISYSYPGKQNPALANISLVIKKGETIGFIGMSGAGKSTIVDVILGLLPPSDGAILVDGKDIQNNLRGWQCQIGYVPQTIFLTDDTLLRNVAFGIPAGKIDEDTVWSALKAAQLESFVKSLPDGLDAVLGERGITLSGGQRQRIGIARALYHDPEILVLDEATSSLDTSTEREVMSAIHALHGNKTIIIVAHRLSTVERCDRLYRLDDGRIADEGSPEKVIDALQEGHSVWMK